MRELVIFAEDVGHERFLTALIGRFAAHFEVEIRILAQSVRGGHGTVLTELRTFMRDLHRRPGGSPDLLIVATDGNCKGFVARRRELEAITEALQAITVYAIPDPHIERWLLLDSAAFKRVLGKGCAAPNQKCERERYKELLRTAVRDAGRLPRLGGIEFAQRLVQAMDLQRVALQDASLGRLIGDLRDHFAQWSGRPASLPPSQEATEEDTDE